MQTGIPGSWTGQNRLENWKHTREKEAGKLQKHEESWKVYLAGESSQILKVDTGTDNDLKET